MNNKTFKIATINIVMLGLYMKFGTIGFWFIGVTGFLAVWLLMLVDSFFHIILAGDSFEKYTLLKKRPFKGYPSDLFQANLRACKKSNIPEKTGFIMMLAVFLTAIYLLYLLLHK